MKRNICSIIWGIAIVIVGVIFLGNTANWWDLDIFFNGWWTLFIIIPSIIDIFTKHTYFSSFLFLAIGVLLLLGCQNIIDWENVWDLFIPILIIMVGLTFILKPNFKKSIKVDKKGNLQYIGVFSGCQEKVVDKFKGASCTAVFGGVDLDLSECEIKDDVIIDTLSVFGGIDIKVPNNVKVKSTGIPIFGGLENKATQKVDTKSPTIYINYVCVFGGTEIK